MTQKRPGRQEKSDKAPALRGARAVALPRIRTQYSPADSPTNSIAVHSTFVERHPRRKPK
jgi:hypothetical protein